MKFKSLLIATALAVIAAASAQAQMLGGISVSPATVKAGQPVTVTATIDVIQGNYCGYAVFYGDGAVKDGVSDVSNVGPFVSTHTYAKAGTYTVSMGGRHVQSHPNCGGADKSTTVVVTEGDKPMAAKAAMPVAASVCPDKWKLVPKSSNAKTGAFACSAKPGTALPETKPVCKGELTYYENGKKGQLGCRP